MIKRFVLTLSILCLLFSFTAAAEEPPIASLEPYGEFYILGEDDERVAEILDIPLEELKPLEDSYVAVNGDNTKQIRLSVQITDFSNSIGNISNLSNDKLISLGPELSGIEGAKGEVMNKDGQKFVKVQLRSADEGGEYILTQYITVAARRRFILSFYTHMGEDTDYIEKTFETFGSDCFNSDTADKKTQGIQYILLCAAGLFLIICIVVAISIIIDIRKNKNEEITKTKEPLD